MKFLYLLPLLVGAVPKLRHLSPTHHILSFDECPCEGGRADGCCKRLPKNLIRDDADILPSVDPTTTVNPEDPLPPFDSAVIPATPDYDLPPVDPSVSPPTDYDLPPTLPATVDPVSSYGSSPIARPVTDLMLLTVYKGHDESDRPGIADYGDVLQDFRQGWTLWPSWVIRFQLDEGLSNCARTSVNVALAVINSRTCLQFTEQPLVGEQSTTTDPSILHISESGQGCFASLGYRPGENIVNIGSGCLNVGTIMHLAMHAVGMFHTHQRPDRDSFVRVNSQFIDQNRMGGSLASSKFGAVFGKVDSGDSVVSKSTGGNAWASNLGVYDFSSLMHNGPCHYSTGQEFGGAETECQIEPTLGDNGGANFRGNFTDTGNRQTLSEQDVTTLNAMYRCLVDSESLPPSLPADSVTAETTMCTIEDAADFEWSEVALEGKPLTGMVTAGSVTTAAPTANPNEYSAFTNVLRDSSDAKLYQILLIGVAVVLLIAAGFMYLAHRNRQAKRSARRLLRAPEAPQTVESTDSEALAEIEDERGGR